MTSDRELAELQFELAENGIRSLVMGGQAVRYYDLNRTTDDFDFYVSPESGASVERWLATRQVIEIDVSRESTVRRFQFQSQRNAHELKLKLWYGGRLFPAFSDAYQRREHGAYGDRPCDFLSINDLIQTKETAREKDWVDIFFLEELQDARLRAAVRSGVSSPAETLSYLRSRRGLESALRDGCLYNAGNVREAILRTENPITVASLLPAVRDVTLKRVRIEAAVEQRLRSILVGSPLHFSVVEAVRQKYIHDCMLVGAHEPGVSKRSSKQERKEKASAGRKAENRIGSSPAI